VPYLARGEQQSAPDAPDIDRIFERAVELRAETQRPDPPGAEPGSSLAGDDARLGYLQLSHIVWAAHVRAVDHLSECGYGDRTSSWWT